MSDLQDALESDAALAVAFLSGMRLKGENEGWSDEALSRLDGVSDLILQQVDAARRVANPSADVLRRVAKAIRGMQSNQDLADPMVLAKEALAALTPPGDTE